MGGWDRCGEGGGWLIHIRVWVGDTGGGFYLIVFSLFVLLSFSVSCPVSFLIEYSMIALVPVCLFFICFCCLWSL